MVIVIMTLRDAILDFVCLFVFIGFFFFIYYYSFALHSPHGELIRTHTLLCSNGAVRESRTTQCRDFDKNKITFSLCFLFV